MPAHAQASEGGLIPDLGVFFLQRASHRACLTAAIDTNNVHRSDALLQRPMVRTAYAAKY
jgi:hypothetical protein